MTDDLQISWTGPTQFEEFRLELKNALRSSIPAISNGQIEISFDVHPLEKLTWPTAIHHGSKELATEKIRILLRFEPRVVNPFSFLRHNEKKFDFIVDFGLRSSSALAWPQHPSMLKSNFNETNLRLQRFVLVNSNKFSSVSGEQYSLRKKLRLQSKEVDLFGHGWGNIPPLQKFRMLVLGVIFGSLGGALPNWKAVSTWLLNDDVGLGALQDKIASMETYSFAIVIENESSYLSEKLFDALAAGCIPVYVGLDPLPPSLEELVVRSKPTVHDLLAAMEKAKNRDRTRWLLQVKSYFSGEEIGHHSVEKVAARTARIISDFLAETYSDH